MSNDETHTIIINLISWYYFYIIHKQTSAKAHCKSSLNTFKVAGFLFKISIKKYEKISQYYKIVL